MSFSVICLKFSNTAVRSSRQLSFVSIFLTDDSMTSSFFKRFRISSTFSEKFAVISSAVKIVSSSAISSSVETVCRDFLLLGEEAESSELADILFLLFPNSSVINSAICRYGDLGYFKKLRTATISVFTPPLLVPVTMTVGNQLYSSLSLLKRQSLLMLTA